MSRLIQRQEFKAGLFMKSSLFVAVILVLAGIFTACDTPMGLGDPVDTIPPEITIISPEINKSFGVMVLGDPIQLSGTWSSNSGVKSLRVQITDTRNKKVFSNSLKNYTVNSDGTWKANIVIPEPGEGGESEYVIKVLAKSGCPVEGSDEVTIRVDIMAPWVKTAWISRHPNSNIVQETLFEKSYYDRIIDFNDNFAYRNITEGTRDDFQNDFFTLKLEVAANLAGVAATRLFVLDENDNVLNSSDSSGRVPSREPVNPKLPEWDISTADLIAWAGSTYAEGPHYIHFEVWAWNQLEWGDIPWNAEPPAPAPGQEGLSVRKQRINGTCWYPESDRPHIIVNDKGATTGFISLNTNSSLSLSVFDDDKLQGIYAGLIPLDVYDTWRDIQTDAEFYESLRTDLTKRNKVITYVNDENLFEPIPGTDNRDNIIYLSDLAAGEFRLIVLALDDKSGLYNTPYDVVWGVNMPMRVQVMDAAKPIIIVESPLENTFPSLNSGTKFTITGYTISMAETTMVLIAWARDSLNPSSLEVESAFTAVAGSGYVSNPDGPAYNDANTYGLNIWKLPVGVKVPFVLNGDTYQRNDFQKTFDILEDFKVSGVIENKFKRFYIYTVNTSGGNTIMPYRLSNYTERPAIEVVYPSRDLMVHDNRQDLVLKMRVSPKGVPLDPDSIKIKDITGSSSNSEVNAANNNKYFTEPSGPVLVNGEYCRTVAVNNLNVVNDNYFREGSRRTYRFEAIDVLGNGIDIPVERKIIMSNLPALMYITSTNASGIYGQGTELRFEAVFSMPVMVSGSPRLKLFFSDPGTSAPPTEAPVSAYALHEWSPAAANTVVFTYTVPDNVYAAKLYTSLNPIDLNGGTMETTETGGGSAKIDFYDQTDSLQNRIEIGMDGRRPKVTGVAFSQITAPSGLVWPSGSSYFNQGKTITLELKTDKQVRISGAPKAYLNVGLPGAADAVFSSVTHTGSASTLRFAYTVDVPNRPETQVAWTNSGGRWIATSTGAAMSVLTDDTITDMYGNPIILPNEDSTLVANDFNGNNANMRAYIITAEVPTPTFTLSNVGGILSDPVRVNGDVTITINRGTGAASNRLSYSVEGGNYPRPLAGAVTTATIMEKAKDPTELGYPDNLSSLYKSSLFQVTAWQEDLAGNRSLVNAPVRAVEINSRAPELAVITCTQPNGAYRKGQELTFNLAFSRPVRAKANSTVTLTLKGTKTGYESTTNITATQGAVVEGWNSIFTINWTIPAGLQMMDIKAQEILLTGLEDQYGNTLKNYSGSAAEDDYRRQITNTSSFNLDRDSTATSLGLKVDSDVPYITSYTPAAPAGSAGNYNGGIIASRQNPQIVLKFDKDVWAQAGKSIIIRPYDKWALPPVLSSADFDTLYNGTFYDNAIDPYSNTLVSGTMKTEYQKRLKWVDANGLPQAPIADVFKYNYYSYTTKGVVPIGGKVRPDTTAKWVLGFRYDLYEGMDNLRDVFNAARWKWQIISATSGLVSIVGDTVTISLSEPLDAGRIWEVLMSPGAFRDQAGNESEGIISNPNSVVQGYRFWSGDTEAPVVRVDRYSQGDHYQGTFSANLNGYNSFGAANRPKIDTRVRIDCETPGASIYYDTIRTKFLPNAAGTGVNTSVVFTTTATTGTPNYSTAAGFFNHPSANAGLNATPSGANISGAYKNPGWGNNWIGNGGSHDRGTNANSQALAVPISSVKDADGFFTSLLVPILNETTGSAMDPAVLNGTILWGDLMAKGTSLVSGTALSGAGRQYRDTTASPEYGLPVFDHNSLDGTFSYTNTYGHFFYVGDAYQTSPTGTGSLGNRTVAYDTHSSLYSGRRDYVAAAAQKKTVGTGSSSGPALNASVPSYEGVYKTTWLSRNPRGDAATYRLINQGFDTPVNTTIAGFPLNEATFGGPSGVSGSHYDYYTKMAWRFGNYNDPSQGGFSATTNNHYIWVSWDIVCDWYQKGRAWSNNTATNSMQRRNMNYGAVLCTYGAVTYRFQQFYDNGTTGTGAGATTN